MESIINAECNDCNNNNYQLKVGVILQYVQMALSILISLIYTPLMLKILGQSEYGLYNLASSIISYLSLLSLGFGSSYIRYYYIQKKKDPDNIKSLNGLYFFVFCIIGLIVFICGFFLSQNVSIFLNETYTMHDTNIASILMILLSVNLALSFPMSLFTSYITSQEKFVFQKILNMGKTILSPSLSIVALFLGYGSIGLVVITTFVNFLIDIVNVYFCFHKIGMKLSFKNMKMGLMKDIFLFSSFIAINQIVDQINWQTDKIILGKFISGSAVSIYSIGSTLNNYYIMFSTAVSSVFAPKVNKIIQENSFEKNEELSRLMIKVGRIQFFVLGLIMTGFIFFGQYFLDIWVGQGYKESYFVTLLLICPATISLIQNLGIEILRAENKHKFRSLVYLIIALMNIGISIWLCNLFGIIGVAFGTTLSLILGNGLIMNFYYWKVIKLNIPCFWISILKILPSILIPCLFGLCWLIFLPKNISLFIVCILVYSLIYCVSIYFLGLNNEEKQFVRRIFKHE